MKKFLNEFKTFALKGNVVDMAVGVIIGAAFQGIVTSLTNDVLNPLLGIAFSTDFSNVVFALPNNAHPLRIGAFISPAAPKGPTQEELLAGILAELRAQNEREHAGAK